MYCAWRSTWPGLTRKRMASGVLFRDEAGRLAAALQAVEQGVTALCEQGQRVA